MENNIILSNKVLAEIGKGINLSGLSKQQIFEELVNDTYDKLLKTIGEKEEEGNFLWHLAVDKIKTELLFAYYVISEKFLLSKDYLYSADSFKCDDVFRKLEGVSLDLEKLPNPFVQCDETKEVKALTDDVIRKIGEGIERRASE